MTTPPEENTMPESIEDAPIPEAVERQLPDGGYSSTSEVERTQLGSLALMQATRGRPGVLVVIKVDQMTPEEHEAGEFVLGLESTHGLSLNSSQELLAAVLESQGWTCTEPEGFGG